jgi:hypothetical protein
MKVLKLVNNQGEDSVFVSKDVVSIDHAALDSYSFPRDVLSVDLARLPPPDSSSLFCQTSAPGSIAGSFHRRLFAVQENHCLRHDGAISRLHSEWRCDDARRCTSEKSPEPTAWPLRYSQRVCSDMRGHI